MALFFTLIQHLSRAGWSVVVRRVIELMAANVVVLAVLALPIIFGAGMIYGWAGHGHEGETAHHYIWGKDIWLTQKFFGFRVVLCFTAWIGLAWFYYRSSMAQDLSGDRAITLKMQQASAPALIVFALTATFGSFDLLMSLDSHWFSTMFGVYFFAGSMVSFFATLILLLHFLQKRGVLTGTITVEHYHDLGKWMFGFVFFWGYIAFSQYMLIWYGNIPEETAWLDRRGVATGTFTQAAPGWGWLAVILLFGHFLIPFPGLMSRHVKRCLTSLCFWCVWMLVFHFVDLFWLVTPESLDPHLNLGLQALVSFCCVVGVGGVWLAGFAWLAADRSLLPVRDPRLHESLAFENY